ncbi:sensor domain-containing diguanylate cyclase [Mariprofundus sp. NF]|uniref:sensor domain-containing diguanylate cyclase n=1 Tax=Mariprofundus sp. NF TaxID=2608716 RepID=UPI0015A01AB2|nr:sensor domain-containing diguanylate cyclase [Mariprofundus sp. NF]
MFMMFRIGLNMSDHHVPLADAAQEVMTHTTEFHLWFEELVQGDPSVDANEVWMHLDHAEWYANAMLHGGTNHEGEYIPLDDPLLHEEINQVLILLHDLKEIAHQRLEPGKDSAIGSAIDQVFDASYNKAMEQAQEVEETLRQAIAQEVRNLGLILGAVVFLLVSLVIGIGFIFYKQEAERKLLEEEKLAQEKRYRISIRTANEGYWMTDENGNLLEVNDAYCELTGYSREELMRMNVADLEARERADEVADHIKDIADKGRARFETRHRCKDGRTVCVEVSATVAPFDGALRGFAFIHDLTKRKIAEQALADSEERFSLAMEGSSDGLWDWNLKTNDVVFSKRWKSMLGYSEDELENSFDTWERLVHPNDINKAKQAIDDYLSGKISKYEVEFRMQHKDGHWVDILARGRGVSAKGDNGYKRLIGTHVDISERKQLQFKLQRQANIDGLTEIYNRIYMNRKLEDEVQRAIRFQTPLSLLMLDLDYFKQINDTYGHQAGDACLVELATLMKGLVRSVDTCARYGGEEFVIILPQTSPENAMVFAERLRQKVENMVVRYDDQSIQYTISIGIKSLSQIEKQSSEELLKGADNSLYLAKQNGRNRSVSYPMVDPSSE